MDENQVVDSSLPLDAGKQEVKDASYVGDVSLTSIKDTAVRQTPPTQDYDPRPQYDVVRTIITCSFIVIFALTVFASLAIVVWAGSDWTNAKELIQLLLPAETALMGSAIGFYFGSQKTS